MKARIGDAEFDANGDEEQVSKRFFQWLEIVKRRQLEKLRSERRRLVSQIAMLQIEVDGIDESIARLAR